MTPTDALRRLIDSAWLMIADIDTCGRDVDQAYRLDLHDAVTAARAALAADEKDKSELVAALRMAVQVAGEARLVWDAAPAGMRAGKILIALSGECPGYRADTDEIHRILAKHAKE